jgi:hypothetical protein
MTAKLLASCRKMDLMDLSADGPECESFRHCGWIFRWRYGCKISCSRELEALSVALHTGALPLPEMTYASHFVEALHLRSGMRLSFTAQGALASWHALQTSNSPLVGGSRVPVDVTNHDYTFTCEYDGEVGGVAGGPAALASPSPASIPMDLITQRTPILAFASVPLFASDLSDRGTVEAVVKLRVMDTYFLLLCRQFTRIDRDRVRLRDTRYFHLFDAGAGAAGAQPPPRSLLLRDVQLRVGGTAQVAAAAGEGGGGGGSGGGGASQGSPCSTLGTGAALQGSLGLPVGLPSFLLPTAAEAPPSPPLAPRPAVHPTVLASMRERAEKQGLRVLDDGTLVGQEQEGGGLGGGGGAPPASPGAAWPARPGSTLPSQLSPAALLQCTGPLPPLAVTAEQSYAALQPLVHRAEEIALE